MMQRTLPSTVLLVLASTLIGAQSSVPLRFEVASIKLDPKQGRGAPRRTGEISIPPLTVLPGGSVESYGHTLRNLIAVVYDVNQRFQKIEGKQDLLEAEFGSRRRRPLPL